MRLTILFFCIASLTLALALPTWKQVADIPQTLSSSVRVGTSKALDLGEQALLHGRAFLPRRRQLGLVSMCRDYYDEFPESCPQSPEDQNDLVQLENTFFDYAPSSSPQIGSDAR